MKVVILVGGEGTRLRPLTCNITKAMVPILNMPFLEYLIRYLKEHSIRDITLAMSYLPDRIQSYFGDGAEFGVHLTYLVEEQPLGTAGAVKNAEALLDEPFFVFNGELDPELFEQCAADILRAIYPGLVPIRGGSDAGMDGAISDAEGVF